jgi:hypothetical protein
MLNAFLEGRASGLERHGVNEDRALALYTRRVFRISEREAPRIDLADSVYEIEMRIGKRLPRLGMNCVQGGGAGAPQLVEVVPVLRRTVAGVVETEFNAVPPQEHDRRSGVISLRVKLPQSGREPVQQRPQAQDSAGSTRLGTTNDASFECSTGVVK